MIKRQFYSVDRGAEDGSDPSQSFSSSSGDGAAASSADDDDAHSPIHAEADDAAAAAAAAAEEEASSPSDETQCINTDIDNSRTLKEKTKKTSRPDLSSQWADLVAETLNEEASAFNDECVLQFKKVLKCRLCPKTLCLSSESMQAHLSSKKHARSLRLLSKGRLKAMLNSDGEEEEQGETHAERHARILQSFQKQDEEHVSKRKQNSGRQRQHLRAIKRRRKEKLSTAAKGKFGIGR